MRLSYAIDMRYGVLYDVASSVFAGQPVDVTMGHADVIWQGDANEQALRLLAHCTTPATPINVTGPRHTSVRWLAARVRQALRPHAGADRAGGAHRLARSTPRSRRRCSASRACRSTTMIDWVADWVRRGGPSLGKPTHFSTRDGKY